MRRPIWDKVLRNTQKKSTKNDLKKLRKKKIRNTNKENT